MDYGSVTKFHSEIKKAFMIGILERLLGDLLQTDKNNEPISFMWAEKHF